MSIDNLPPELREQSTTQAEAEGTPEDRALFDQLADAVRKHKARERAAHRAEGIREAADALDAQTCQCGCRRAVGFLRRLADETAPPSTLRQAHAAKVLRDEATKIRAASPKHYMCDSGFGDPACTYEEVAELIERHAAEADETTEEPTT